MWEDVTAKLCEYSEECPDVTLGYNEGNNIEAHAENFQWISYV